MIKGFRCPDGHKVEVHQCLSLCRLEQRCMPRPILLNMSAPKDGIEGKYSVTQLIAPTRITYLRLANELYVEPKSLIKSFYGTAMHATTSSLLGLAEVRLSDEQCSGKFDLLDEGDMIDYKVWGSYRVARALGMQSIRVMNPATNRLNTKWVPGGEPDIAEETLQLNRYRMLAEKEGYLMHSMHLFVIVKDAELQTAYGRGITEPTYWIHIPRLDNDEVYAYFEKKKLALEQAIASGTTECCDSIENWGGNRCKYCDVAEFCNVGNAMLQIQEDNENQVTMAQ